MDQKKQDKKTTEPEGSQGRADYHPGSTTQGGSDYGQGSLQLSGNSYQQGSEKTRAPTTIMNMVNLLRSKTMSQVKAQNQVNKGVNCRLLY